MKGNVYVRSGPGTDFTITQQVVLQGSVVRIVERQPSWVHILFPHQGPVEIDGWIPERWLEVVPSP